MNTSYELRSVRGDRPVYVFDDVTRARTERDRAAERGVPLKIIKVTRSEEPIH